MDCEICYCHASALNALLPSRSFRGSLNLITIIFSKVLLSPKISPFRCAENVQFSLDTLCYTQLSRSQKYDACLSIISGKILENVKFSGYVK